MEPYHELFKLAAQKALRKNIIILHNHVLYSTLHYLGITQRNFNLNYYKIFFKILTLTFTLQADGHEGEHY